MGGICANAGGRCLRAARFVAMSTPPSWVPEPLLPDAQPVATPTSSGFGAHPIHAAPADPYGAPQYTAPQYIDDQYTADPYGVPSPSAVSELQQYGYPTAYGFSDASQRTNGLAIASLVTSLAALVIPITAPIGMVLGIVALRAIRRDGSQGRGLAIAGIIVGAAWTLVMVVVAVFFIALVATFPDAGSFST